MKQTAIIGLRTSVTGIILLGILFLPLTVFAAEPTTLEEFESIDRGFKTFSEETFEGNGRTCTTCHIPGRQYNINPNDIRRAKVKDRFLIFAKNVPGLENPTLVKKLALFNIEGGNALDPEADGEEHPIFRGSMAIGPFALTTVGGGAPFTTDGPQMGWSGDASPGGQFHHGNADINADASIRAFPNGAIAQHNPVTLNRIAKTTACDDLSIDDPHAYCNKPYDFRFASNQELDDLEAFQNWLGRRDEFSLDTLTFTDTRVASGKSVFLSNEAGCNFCHENGGATVNPAPNVFLNVNQHTNTRLESDRISAETGVFLPEDRGNTSPMGIFPPGIAIPEDFSFNIQPAIEGARKEAFFHNHAFVDSVEKASEFYFTENFATSTGRTEILRAIFTGIGAPPGVPLGGDGSGNDKIDDLDDFLAAKGPNAINEIGAFLRALSAWYSLKDCERLIDEAIARIDVGASIKNPIRHCGFNLGDVNQVFIKAKFRNLHKRIAKKMYGLKNQLFKVMYKHQYGASDSKTIRRLEKIKAKISAHRNAIAILEEPEPVEVAATDS